MLNTLCEDRNNKLRAQMAKKPGIDPKKIRRKNREKRVKEKLLNRKLGILRKATVLYNSQRYNQAFTTIVIAVKQIKQEKTRNSKER